MLKVGAAATAAAQASEFGPPLIDCDVHIAVPSTQAIMPYLDEYWRAQFLMRGIWGGIVLPR